MRSRTQFKANAESEEVSDLSVTKVFRTKMAFSNISRKRAVYLQVTSPLLMPKDIELKRQETTIGRSSECHVSVPLPNVSRIHARLVYHDHEYRIEDLGSTNGTFVNGVQIQRCIMRHNDQIQIGDAKIIYLEERPW
jgi:hypothetical protein